MRGLSAKQKKSLITYINDNDIDIESIIDFSGYILNHNPEYYDKLFDMNMHEDFNSTVNRFVMDVIKESKQWKH